MKVLLAIAVIAIACVHMTNAAPPISDLQVIILSTSKFWFNFRQGTNALLIYDILRKNGVKDENIILMIPENVACNPRNNNPGWVNYIDDDLSMNLFKGVEIDYKLTDVSVYTLTNMLRGRYNKYTPRSKRLVTGKNTRILTYFTGHGGDGYMKMQDTDVMMDEELKVILEESYLKSYYKEMLMINDSCAAATVFEKLTTTSPNIFALGSSSRGEYSYSYGRDTNLGISVVDRFTRLNYLFLSQQMSSSKDAVVSDMMKEYSEAVLNGHFGYTNTHFKKTQRNIHLKDYFTNQNPKKQTLIELNKNDSQFQQLSSILDEITALPQVDFNIINKPFSAQ